MPVMIKVYFQMTLSRTHAERLKALVQNDIYEDETADDMVAREHIFERIDNGNVDPGGRMRESTVTFCMYEKPASWLERLVQGPIYEDETEEEQEMRLKIKEEFRCPNLQHVRECMVRWDDIPF